MTATVMDGEALAARIKEDLSDRITVLAEKGVTAGLGTVLVGDDGPSHKYVSMKHADCAELGIASRDIRLPASATQDEVRAAVAELNADAAVHAFILQYPFPGDLDYDEAVLAVDPAKDADGLHPVNLGRLVMGAELRANLGVARLGFDAAARRVCASVRRSLRWRGRRLDGWWVCIRHIACRPIRRQWSGGADVDGDDHRPAKP